MKNKAISYPYMGWMGLFVVAPILIISIYAFSSPQGGFTTDHFRDMLKFTAAFGRSFLLAGIATAISLLIGYPLAYFLARERSWLNRTATMLIMLPMSVFGLGPYQLVDTRGAIVLGMVYNFLPYMILPIFSVIDKIDPKIIEAAQDLGADGRTIFRRIVLPISLPGVLSGITMVFIPAVSTFAISGLLGGGKTLLLGNLIDMQFLGGAYNPHLGSAISLVMMVIVMLAMALMNRFGEGEEGVSVL